MRNKRKVRVISNLICPECGLNFPLPRTHGEKRKNGHIKDVYCPKCNKVQKFKEYKYNQSYRTLDGEILEKAE